MVPLRGGGGAGGAAPRFGPVLGEDEVREAAGGGGGGGALDRRAAFSSCSRFSLIHDITNSLLSSSISSVTPMLANSALKFGSRESANDARLEAG